MRTINTIGYCPDLFSWGGISHGPDEQETYGELRELIDLGVGELVRAGKYLPPPITRPMGEAIGV